MPVEVAGSQVPRLMKGDGTAARIKMVPKSSKVSKEAAVYICKKAGILDVPMVIGKVGNCKADDDNPLLWDITVEPAVKIDEMSTVVVLIMNP